MKIEIDLGDVYSEEDQSVQSAIREEIRRQVLADVWGKVREQVLKEVSERVKEEIIQQLAPRISEAISAAINTGELELVKGKKTTILEHVSNLFHNNSNWNSVGNHVSNLAEQHAKALKARYDVIFANRLVVKINEAGMLKEDVAKLLLEG